MNASFCAGPRVAQYWRMPGGPPPVSRYRRRIAAHRTTPDDPHRTAEPRPTCRRHHTTLRRTRTRRTHVTHADTATQTAGSRPARPPLLEMQDIEISFGGVPALRGAHLSVVAGEVHALIGQNGAGKSTMIKILTGAYRRPG